MAQIIKNCEDVRRTSNYASIHGLHRGLRDLQNLTVLGRGRNKIPIYFSEIKMFKCYGNYLDQPDDSKFTPAGKKCDEPYWWSSTSAGYIQGTEVPPKPKLFNFGDEVVFHYQGIQFFLKTKIKNFGDII